VLNGPLLFGWLFPGARLDTHAPTEVVEIPGHALLRDSQEMAYRTYEEVRRWRRAGGSWVRGTVDNVRDSETDRFRRSRRRQAGMNWARRNRPIRCAAGFG
jgi:hypothetical protein